MKLSSFIILIFCIYFIFFASGELSADEYKKVIHEFIENTETFKKPTNSRHFLKENNENVIKNCINAGEYDFIIIGVGTSGCVLANRLSEVSDWSIIGLEAGDEETIVSNIPAMTEYLPLTKFNWGFTVVPQKNSLLSYINKTQILATGKALGGTSVINLMIYARGNREDYDSWYDQGNPGWSYDSVLQYFKRSENAKFFIPDPGFHGTGGNFDVVEVEKISTISYDYLFANEELGRRIVADYDGMTQKSFSFLKKISHHGRRQSSAKSFLQPVLSRKNLKILNNTLVIKILIQNKIAYGVQYVRDGKSYCIKAKKEVILSAGAINSPQLLMLSGIGPKDHLNKFKIEVAHDLPGVGRNLWDHLAYSHQFFKTNYTLKEESLEQNIQSYLKGCGPLTLVDSLQDIGFVGLNTDKIMNPSIEYLMRVGKMKNNSYDYYKQKLYSKDIYNFVYKPLEGKTFWNNLLVLSQPKSRGTVTLKSKSPFDFPNIDPNYLNNDDDVTTLIKAYNDSIKISKTESLKKFDSKLHKVDLPKCRKYKIDSDAHTGCLIRNLASSINDFGGTCKMGSPFDSQAVVNNKLQVCGIKKLRIVDTSVIPVPIGAQINAAAYMIAEKASDAIKLSYGIPVF